MIHWRTILRRARRVSPPGSARRLLGVRPAGLRHEELRVVLVVLFAIVLEAILHTTDGLTALDGLALTIIALLTAREDGLVLLSVHLRRARLWFWHRQELLGRGAVWLLDIVVRLRRFRLGRRHVHPLGLRHHRFVLIDVLLFDDCRVLALALFIVTKSSFIIFAEPKPLLLVSDEDFDILVKAISGRVERKQLVKIHKHYFLLKYINEINLLRKINFN